MLHSRKESIGMKKFTSGNLADFFDISPSTLKYYDKEGLLKPSYTDPNSHYRYYSLSDVYNLLIIRQLRQIKLPLDVICDYIHHRNCSNALKVLSTREQELTEQINQLNRERNDISRRIHLLRMSQSQRNMMGQILEKYLPERKCVYSEIISHDSEGFFYSILQLDTMIPGGISAFTGHNLGWVTQKADFLAGKIPDTFQLFLLNDSPNTGTFDNGMTMSIPEGRYICTYYTNGKKGEQLCAKKLLRYLKEHSLTPIGDVLNIAHIEETITLDVKEKLYEMQVPVKSMTSDPT